MVSNNRCWNINEKIIVNRNKYRFNYIKHVIKYTYSNVRAILLCIYKLLRSLKVKCNIIMQLIEDYTNCQY